MMSSNYQNVLVGVVGTTIYLGIALVSLMKLKRVRSKRVFKILLLFVATAALELPLLFDITIHSFSTAPRIAVAFTIFGESLFFLAYSLTLVALVKRLSSNYFIRLIFGIPIFAGVNILFAIVNIVIIVRCLRGHNGFVNLHYYSSVMLAEFTRNLLYALSSTMIASYASLGSKSNLSSDITFGCICCLCFALGVCSSAAGNWQWLLVTQFIARAGPMLAGMRLLQIWSLVSRRGPHSSAEQQAVTVTSDHNNTSEPLVTSLHCGNDQLTSVTPLSSLPRVNTSSTEDSAMSLARWKLLSGGSDCQCQRLEVVIRSSNINISESDSEYEETEMFEDDDDDSVFDEGEGGGGADNKYQSYTYTAMFGRGREDDYDMSDEEN